MSYPQSCSHKPSASPTSSPGKLHSSACENGCKNTTYSFQSARTGADHQRVNTKLSQFRNTVLVEPPLQIWLQAPLGDHTRGEELMGEGPLHRNSQSGLACKSQLAQNSRLAASVLWLPRWWVHGSTWLLSRPHKGLHSSLFVGSAFIPTGSTAPGGKRASEMFSCQPWSLNAVACLEWLMFTQNWALLSFVEM